MQNEKKRPYVAVYHELLCAGRITNTETGETLEWNMGDRVVYCWMLSEYESFRKLGNPMYHNIDTIAARLALSTKTIERHIKTLDRIGLITKTKVKVQGGVYSNNYVVHDVFSSKFVLHLCLLENDKSMLELIKGTYKPVTKSVNKITKPKSFVQEIDDCPF